MKNMIGKVKLRLPACIIALAAFLHCGNAMAGDNEWTLNADGTEWLYTYTTGRYPTTFSNAGYTYNGFAQGKITFAFRNLRVTDRIANAQWADFGMRIGKAGDQSEHSTIPMLQSSGTVQVYLYYSNGTLAYDVSRNANFPHFHYYNSNITDDGIVELNDEPVLPYGFWWNLDLQRSIKIFFQRPNGEILETIRIRHPLDKQAKCFSTTEGNVRNYRTNLWNRYDAGNIQQNKSVSYMVDRGDGTYLFNPVWDQFVRTSNDVVVAENVYKKDALDWTGKVGSESVVAAVLNTQTGKYELSLGTSFPLNLFKDKDDKRLHSLMQAVVRAPKGKVVRMGYKYYNINDKKVYPVDFEFARVTGVGIDDATTGNTAYGTVYPTGRVDYLKRIANGGWVKLEIPVKLNQDAEDMKEVDTRGWMVLTSDAPFDVSDVYMLWRPDQPGFYQTSANRFELSNTDKDVNLSWVDLSGENKFSLFDRGANLNRVVKVNPATTLGMHGHEHPCNVVAAGRTPLLYMTDKGVRQMDGNGVYVHTGAWAGDDVEQYMKSGYTFGVDEGFKADKVWFDRNFARKYDSVRKKEFGMATVCLPFAMTADDLARFNVDKAYAFVSAEGNSATFTPVTATEADRPYLIEPQVAITTAHETPLEFTDKEIPASNIAAGDFIGTYAYRDLPAHETEGGKSYTNYIFGFNTQQFNYVSPAGASFKPFRAYLRSSGEDAPRSITINITDGDVTGINEVAESPAAAPLFTIDGVMVSTDGNTAGLRPGVYIRGNKKFVVK